MPIAIPDDMSAAVESTLAAFKQTVAQLDILIDAHEAHPKTKRQADVIAPAKADEFVQQSQKLFG